VGPLGPTITAGGNGADDWPTLIATLNANAYQATVTLSPANGPFYCRTPGSSLPLASGVRLRCEPGVVIVSELVPGGALGDYLQTPWFAGPTLFGNEMAIVGIPALFATHLTVTSVDPACTPGSFIKVFSTIPNVAQTHKVTAITGNVLTLDAADPVLHTWTGGASAQVIVPPQAIDLDFNGAEMTGTGDRFGEIACAYRCSARNLRITSRLGSPTAFGWSFDVGGAHNILTGFSVDGGGLTNAGVALESNTFGTLTNCSLSAVGITSSSAAVFVPSNCVVLVENIRIANCWTGIQLVASGAGDVSGTSFAQIDNIVILDQLGGYGVLEGDGQQVQYGKIQILSGVGDGLHLSLEVAAGPQGVQIESLIATGLTGTALYASGASVDVAQLSASNCNLPVDAEAGATVTVSDLTSQNCTGGIVGLANASLRIVRGTWTATFTGGWPTQTLGDGANPWTFVIESGSVALGGAGTKNLIDGQGMANLSLTNLQVTKDGLVTARYGVYLQHAGGNTVYRGPHVNLTAFQTPWAFFNNDAVNFGTVALDGHVPVSVTGGNFLADTPIVLGLNTAGSTPGQGAPYFAAAQGAGTFSVVSPTVNCNDILDWSGY
jgi:hypothetical protein